MSRSGFPRDYGRQYQEDVGALEGGRALDVIAHGVPTTVADGFLAGPLEPCGAKLPKSPTTRRPSAAAAVLEYTTSSGA